MLSAWSQNAVHVTRLRLGGGDTPNASILAPKKVLLAFDAVKRNVPVMKSSRVLEHFLETFLSS